MQSISIILTSAFSFVQNFTQPWIGGRLTEGRGPTACGPTHPYNPDVRSTFGDNDIHTYAWPSRGGVIVLERPDAIDFEILGLDPLDPPEKRLPDDASEDAFSQRLLLLGAKWWDSEERFSFAGGFDYGDMWPGNVRSAHSDNSFTYIERPEPTMREQRWVKVGWPSTGGLWVTESNGLWGPGEFDGVEILDPPFEGPRPSIVRMARTMDERCRILRGRLDAKFYQNLSDYSGQTFLRAWEWKETGEVGRLLTPDETYHEWRYSRGQRGGEMTDGPDADK